jgi:hypothetical protein
MRYCEIQDHDRRYLIRFMCRPLAVSAAVRRDAPVLMHRSDPQQGALLTHSAVETFEYPAAIASLPPASSEIGCIIGIGSCSRDR